MIRETTTENGVVRGLPAADPRITAFKGVPFAAPPVGENRWRAPQPCANWEGVLNAFDFAPISVQDTPGLGDDIYCREWHVDPQIAISEDCLYLNIWTNAKTADEKLPVFVWFFGGGFQWGYTAEMEFDGERIARRGIVAVTVNYRLGAFGFLTHPSITSAQPDAPANFGLLDQQAGLKWVIRNIAAFGGDPGNITIAGQSAGGGSVMAHLASPQSRGLFQKAVVMSGIIHNPYYGNSVMSPRSLAVSEKTGERFFKFLGVSSLEDARRLDAFFIREKYASFAAGGDGGDTGGGPFGLRFTPVIDNIYCTGDSAKMLAQNDYAGVPVMAGNTEDEFKNTITAAGDEAFKAEASKLFGEDAGTFLDFEEAWKKDANGGYAPVSGVECGIKTVFSQSRAHGNKNNCYYYKFDTDIPGWDNPGTFHSCDLWFFFETLAKCWRPYTGRHYDLARQMCNYISNFIKNGDPNGNDSDGTAMPQWNPYGTQSRSEMIFTSNGAKACENTESEFMRFLVEHSSKKYF